VAERSAEREGDDYQTAKRAYLGALERNTTCVNVVLASGKTGTTSIAHSLKRAGLAPVFHIHNLGTGSSAAREREYRERAPEARPHHIWEAQWLAVHPPTVTRRWKIVTSVRDPIAQTVSTWFQQGSRFGRTADSPAAVVEELSTQWARIGPDWFDFQFGRLLGLDVYQHPFDPAHGYGAIETASMDVLLLRQESLDRAQAALREFFELPGLTFRSENVSGEKEYGPLYRDVLDRVRLPEALVDKVYSSRLARHFYSAEEIDRFRRHWTRASSA